MPAYLQVLKVNSWSSSDDRVWIWTHNLPTDTAASLGLEDRFPSDHCVYNKLVHQPNLQRSVYHLK